MNVPDFLLSLFQFAWTVLKMLPPIAWKHDMRCASSVGVKINSQHLAEQIHLDKTAGLWYVLARRRPLDTDTHTCPQSAPHGYTTPAGSLLWKGESENVVFILCSQRPCQFFSSHVQLNKPPSKCSALWVEKQFAATSCWWLINKC